jgi:hypothetical protein
LAYVFTHWACSLFLTALSRPVVDHEKLGTEEDEVVPGLVELEVAVPRLSPAVR